MLWLSKSYRLQGYNSDHQIYINCPVMLTSKGTSVKLGRWNRLAAFLKHTVPHLSEQHCVAHNEALVSLISNIKVKSRIDLTILTWIILCK